MHKGVYIDKVGGYDIIDCRECGFVHIDPVPSPEELERVYSDEYYTEEKPLFIVNQEEDIEWWRTVFDDRYSFFEQALRPDRRRILDIGCGPGLFLKRGMERGWECTGVEPSKQAAAYARRLGARVLNTFLDKAMEDPLLARAFDVVHLSEVLEHIPDPLECLRNAYGLLNEGGVICVVVPNDYNPFQKVLRETHGFEPFWVAPPHHINYFDYDSVERVLKKAGFSVRERTAMFPMDIFLLMGDNYVGDDKLGRQCHARRKRLDIALSSPALKEFKRDFYSVMARHNIGRETVVYAVKEKAGEVRNGSG